MESACTHCNAFQAQSTHIRKHSSSSNTHNDGSRHNSSSAPGHQMMLDS
jgi:hypothetical protein